VHSHTQFTLSAQAVHRLSTTPAPAQSSRDQKGDTKPVPYWGPTEISRQRITFSDHGEVARIWCTPVVLYVTHRHAFVRITKLQNQHTKVLWTAVTPQGCILLLSTQCFGQEFCVGSSEVTRNTKLTADCSWNKQCTARSYFTTPKSRGFWSISETHLTDCRCLVPVLSRSTLATSVCYSPNKCAFVTIRTVARLQQMLLTTQLQVKARRPINIVPSPPHFVRNCDSSYWFSDI